MSDDDGISLNIRRSSGGGGIVHAPPALHSAAGTKRKSAKRVTTKRTGSPGESVKLPRPTAETFGEDFSGRAKAKVGAPKRHGDGGVTLVSGPGSKPWERKPNAKSVKKVEPAVSAGPSDKNVARVRLGKAGAANRHDASTFSVDSFSDAKLKLMPALVENLQHKFGASHMTHIQKGSVPAMLQGADVLLRARTGTGKTLAYLVPIVHYLSDRPERLPREKGTHALIIVPTRELAVQVHEPCARPKP
jgi:hypothetical protein